MAEHIFTGFGFGPIQAGLFVKEAFQSGSFARMVVSEIDAELIDGVRANEGSYFVNVAKADGIETLKIDNVELLNPRIEKDSQVLREVLTESTEIATSLPSVDFYDKGGANSAAALIAEGLKNTRAKETIIYTAENNNHAAQILQEAVGERLACLSKRKVQFLNTVIGKMSRVVTDPAEIAETNLTTIAPGIERAFLVEEFNRILVTRSRITDFKPGIEVFIEKDDLLPFEEAKLYGHNAVHALLAYLGALKGYEKMTQLKEDTAVMQTARKAFLNECGAALVKKYSHLEDDLFTITGFRDYAEDLLERMTNPHLGDTVERAGRDVVRKLRINGRLFGTMQLALEYGIEPKNIALGAMAGLAALLQKPQEYNLPDDLRFGDWRTLAGPQIEKILNWLWAGQTCRYTPEIVRYLQDAQRGLIELTSS